MTQRKPIISARRTDNLEALLQKLWALQPMYKDRQAFTIIAGVAALIREIERCHLGSLPATSLPPLTPAAVETAQPDEEPKETETLSPEMTAAEKKRLAEQAEWR